MTLRPGTRLIAVYDTQDEAASAVRRAIDAGVSDDDLRVNDARDHIASVVGEMRDEIVHTTAGPGAAAFTKEMSEGMLLGIVVAGAIGLVLALPFAAIPMGGLALWARLALVAIVGALVGMTVGWIIGGAFAAKREDEPLAAEVGVTVAAPATDEARHALLATDPIRLDLVEDDQPVMTIAHRHSGARQVAHDIGRHMGSERREG
jgi:hypothetical protein